MCIAENIVLLLDKISFYPLLGTLNLNEGLSVTNYPTLRQVKLRSSPNYRQDPPLLRVDIHSRFSDFGNQIRWNFHVALKLLNRQFTGSIEKSALRIISHFSAME